MSSLFLTFHRQLVLSDRAVWLDMSPFFQPPLAKPSLNELHFAKPSLDEPSLVNSQ